MCTLLHLDECVIGQVGLHRGLAREACPGMNTKVEWQLLQNCLGHEFDGVVLIFAECKIIVIVFSAM